MRKEILYRLSTHIDLPVFPQIVLDIEALLADPNTNSAALANLIKLEPVLAGRLLKVANSAFYAGGRRSVSDLTQAVTRLGMQMVREMVYSIELSNMFQGSDYINHPQFWRHCVAVAILNREMARHLGYNQEEIEMAYLGGLMHDIGILVFANLIPEQYALFVKRAQGETLPLYALENQAFDIDHAELGALFIDKWWSMPAGVTAAVSGHHHPYLSRTYHHRIDQLTHLANLFCINQGIVNGTQTAAENFGDKLWGNLGIEAEDVPQLIAKWENNLSLIEVMID